LSGIRVVEIFNRVKSFFFPDRNACSLVTCIVDFRDRDVILDVRSSGSIRVIMRKIWRVKNDAEDKEVVFLTSCEFEVSRMGVGPGGTKLSS
jgi:hypothetical protein